MVILQQSSEDDLTAASEDLKVRNGAERGGRWTLLPEHLSLPSALSAIRWH